MATYFYDRPSTNQRRNRYIYPPSNENLRIFNLVDLFTSTRTGFDAFADAFVYPRTSLMFMQFGVILTRWVGFVEGTQRVILSLYVVADLDSKHGLEFVKEALSSIVRIIIIFPRSSS
jgi:UDP-glucose:glycoprotein glucosyltransferase